MAGTDNPTVAGIVEEFGGDVDALAAEVLALRRVVDELRALLAAEQTEPIVVISPERRPEPPPEPEPWPTLPPRMAEPRAG
jgi:hypothetical protein